MAVSLQMKDRENHPFQILPWIIAHLLGHSMLLLNTSRVGVLDIRYLLNVTRMFKNKSNCFLQERGFMSVEGSAAPY